MSNKTMIRTLQSYKKAGRTSARRRAYFRAFEAKMVYRTTKAENPELSWRTVTKALHKS